MRRSETRGNANRRLTWLGLLLLAFTPACGDGEEDVSGEDASAMDASAMDASAMDANAPSEAGAPDGSASDASAEAAAGDTGNDAGKSDDASGGESDAGKKDSGAPDQGATSGSGAVMPVIVASGGNHQLALSINDGLSWCVTNSDDTYSSYDNPHLLRNITYVDGWFVSGSWRAIFRSRNGYDWENVNPVADNTPTGQWIGQIDYGNGYWVGTGGYGTALRSTDMLAWENVSDELPGNSASRALAFGDGVFVTSRDDSSWWQSTDGINWTQRGSGSVRVVFNGEDFVDNPGYDCAPDGPVCMRFSYGDGIQRRASPGGSWETIGALPEAVERFAFGSAPMADFQPSADIPADVRACLGL